MIAAELPMKAAELPGMPDGPQVVQIELPERPSDIYEALAMARQMFHSTSRFKLSKSEGMQYPILRVAAAKRPVDISCARNWISIIPKRLTIDDASCRDWDGKTKAGNDVHYYYLRGTLRIIVAIGIEKSQRIKMDISCEAMDSQDKCIAKLYTSGYKNMIKILFGFAESEDDDDADAIQIDMPKRVKIRYKTDREPDLESEDALFFSKGSILTEPAKAPRKPNADLLTMDLAGLQSTASACRSVNGEIFGSVMKDLFPQKDYTELDEDGLRRLITKFRAVWDKKEVGQ